MSEGKKPTETGGGEGDGADRLGDPTDRLGLRGRIRVGDIIEIEDRPGLHLVENVSPSGQVTYRKLVKGSAIATSDAIVARLVGRLDR